MPAPRLDVDQEAVKALAITHGLRDAARAFGINEATVRSWSMRGNWLTPALQPKVQPLPKSMQPIATNATSPSEAARNALENIGARSRLNLARAVDTGAAHVAELPGELVLAQADGVGQLVRAGDKLHGWSEGQGGSVGAIALVVVRGADLCDGRVIDV